MPPLEEIIRKHALKNALDFGKATANAVVGKVIAEFPDAKKDMKTTMAKVNEVVNEVNKKSKAEWENEIQKYEFVEKKHEEKELSVPNAEAGKVTTRFPPEPGGYPHIGHAKAAFLNYEIAQHYKGRFILRFDDTNPEKESMEFVQVIREALEWLGIKWEKETYTSDNMVKIYNYAEQLIKKGKAYVCTCPQEKISELRTSQKSCPCRNQRLQDALFRWGNMLNGKYQEGTAVLRFRGDLTSLNTVMRDPTLARVISAKHYRQGKAYHVWPGYDLAVVITDALEGITHPMRSKEYELRDELYYALCDTLGIRRPTLISFSRLEMKGAPVSKRLITPLVKEKKVKGWDDPRLPTIAALKRRGILPEAIKRFVLRFGLTKTESEPTWDILLSENRKLLDSAAKHFYFVPDPVKLKLNLAGSIRFALKGAERSVNLKNKVAVPKADHALLQPGEVFALKDLAFVKPDGKKLVRVDQKAIPEKKVQWVVPEEAIRCEVLIPKDLLKEDGSYNENSLETVKGLCEKECASLQENDVIQFERFGFCRLDRKGKKKLSFIYSC
ncbi:MAG TPA: glutamate--tRNA ligase [Candidatus Bilamarchaeaceae archaeon]|nr:glutamate--tRNA ligase [Candidatus Bilamarchaeaceae archaeon]